MRSGTIIGAGAGFRRRHRRRVRAVVPGIRGHAGRSLARSPWFRMPLTRTAWSAAGCPDRDRDSDRRSVRCAVHRRRASPRVGGILGDDLWPGMVDRRLVRGDAASAPVRAVGGSKGSGAIARLPRLRRGIFAGGVPATDGGCDRLVARGHLGGDDAGVPCHGRGRLRLGHAQRPLRGAGGTARGELRQGSATGTMPCDVTCHRCATGPVDSGVGSSSFPRAASQAAGRR